MRAKRVVAGIWMATTAAAMAAPPAPVTDREQAAFSGYNRRGSKDSQLR